MPDKEWIYTEYVDKVRRYVSGKIQNQQDAEDLVSSFFVKVYQNISLFDAFYIAIPGYTLKQTYICDSYMGLRNKSGAEMEEK